MLRVSLLAYSHRWLGANYAKMTIGCFELIPVPSG